MLSRAKLLCSLCHEIPCKRGPGEDSHPVWPKTTLSSHPLWPQAYFGPRHISVRGILRPQLILRPANEIFKDVILLLPQVQGVPQGEIKAIIINITRSGNKLKKLPCKGKHHQFNLYKPMFSIKAHFLIWNYQACNNSYKLVTCMATNLALDKIKLLKIN